MVARESIGKALQNFGGQTKSILVFLQVAYSEILSVLFQREMPLITSVFNEA